MNTTTLALLVASVLILVYIFKEELLIALLTTALFLVGLGWMATMVIGTIMITIGAIAYKGIKRWVG